MSQTPNPRAYDVWNNRPAFMHNQRYTMNQWEDIHAWLDAALRAERADEREQAAQRVAELTFGWETVERFIVGEAVAAARGGAA